MPPALCITPAKTQRFQARSERTFQQGLLTQGLLRETNITHNFISSRAESQERINGLAKEQFSGAVLSRIPRHVDQLKVFIVYFTCLQSRVDSKLKLKIKVEGIHYRKLNSDLKIFIF